MSLVICVSIYIQTHLVNTFTQKVHSNCITALTLQWRIQQNPTVIQGRCASICTVILSQSPATMSFLNHLSAVFKELSHMHLLGKTNVYICVYVYKNSHTHTYRSRIYIHISIYANTCIQIHVYVYVCVYICLSACETEQDFLTLRIYN